MEKQVLQKKHPEQSGVFGARGTPFFSRPRLRRPPFAPFFGLPSAPGRAAGRLGVAEGVVGLDLLRQRVRASAD